MTNGTFKVMCCYMKVAIQKQCKHIVKLWKYCHTIPNQLQHITIWDGRFRK